MKQRYIWIALAVAISMALGFYLARTWQSLDRPDMASTETNCDLSQQACITEIPGIGQVTLSVVPSPIPLMKNIDWQAVLPNSAVKAKYIDITGINMQMGLNRVALKLGPAKNTWRGRTVLPICSQRKMQWQAKLVLRHAAKRHAVLYRFETLRH